MKKTTGIVLIFLMAMGSWAWGFTVPDPHLTPGVLCTTSDSDFKDLEYPEQIARCQRNLKSAEKTQVAALYGNIPRAEWSKYEFDHLIPLCAGGANHIDNIWPQPIDQAKQKDLLEDHICTSMRAGTMTQQEAVQKVYDWFDSMRSDH